MIGSLQFLQVDFILVILFVTTTCLQSKSANQVQAEAQQTVIKELQTQKNNSCPPWKYMKDENSSCVCGDSIYNNVICEDDQPTVQLLTCHCMSYNDKSKYVEGSCPFLCTNSFYTLIPSQEDIEDICNKQFEQKRHGQLCGKCSNNSSPSPYSYTLECTECSNYKNNWLKYLLIAFLPLTIFFFVAMIFRLNAMSSSLNSFIFLCQLVSSHSSMSMFSIFVKFSQIHSGDPDVNIYVISKFLSSLYGIWNLDFFRMMYEPFCLHPNLSILQILSLDYAVAVYPLFLICVTYFIIKLHDRFGVVQLLWKPAGWLITRINHQWKTSNSLIQAFGTFFLLSYVKIANTSFDILMPVQLYNVSGKVVGLYVYYNGSMEYFGHDHLPYAVLAIFMFVTFNLVPLLLLCLYPCRCFQSCLNCCRLNSQVLRTFIDAFQGCYKFEPYDCRYWAAFYLFLRIAVLSIFAFTQSGYFLLVTGILLVPVAFLLVAVRPYRQNIYNIIDMLMILNIILVFFSAVGFSLSRFDRRYEPFLRVMVGIGTLLPPTYAIIQLLIYILPNRLLEAAKKFLLCVPCKEREELANSTSIEDPLIGIVSESESENSYLLAMEKSCTY